MQCSCRVHWQNSHLPLQEQSQGALIADSAAQMQGGQMAVEEPMKLSSILVASPPKTFPSLTKIIATLGPKSRPVQTIQACLEAGMSVARFDFSWLDSDYHQETIDNLRTACRNTKKLCAIMLDTTGPELHIANKSGKPIELKEGDRVTLTADLTKEPSSTVLPVAYEELASIVKVGDVVFLGQYLFSGSDTSSVWLKVLESTRGEVTCVVNNSAVLGGFVFTMHIAGVRVNLPTLSEKDKKIIATWGASNKVDVVSLHYTRHADDIRELRDFLKAHALEETQVFAKIETVEGLQHFDEILKVADGVIVSRGNLGIDLPPEKVFLFQKYALYKCNMAGKSVVVTRVVDSMTWNLRPTRAEATDVANAILDGADCILLGAETVGGMYPVEAIRTVGRICSEAEAVCNQAHNYRNIVKHVGENMTHIESVASSAVRAASNVNASLIIVFTSSGRAARLIAKYRPSMPVISVVIPRLVSSTLRWKFMGATQARQLLCVRGVGPILASPNIVTSGASNEESGLKVALEHGKALGLLKPGDQVVVFQKIHDASVFKFVEFQA